MPDMIEALLLDAAEKQLPVAQVARQVQTSVTHHAPTEQSVRASLRLGEPNLVEQMLQSPKLDAQQRAGLGTKGAQLLLRDPLAYREAGAMLETLLAAGADAQCLIDGTPGCVRLATQLGRIEAEEARRPSTRAAVGTGAGDALRHCWRAMENAGVNLDEAREARAQAGRNAPALASWRDGRAAGGRSPAGRHP
jgi:hypothetical protein